MKVICKQHCEWVITNSAFSTEHGVAKTKLFRLTHKNAFNTFWQDVLDHVGLLIFALSAKCHFELLVVVKMVFNGTLVAASHKDQCIDARRNSFLSRILNQWLVHNGQ